MALALGLGVEDVLEWCGPVRIPWPGVPIEEAAARLGRHVETLRRWLPPEARQGRERADRIAREVTKQRDYENRRVKGKGKVGAGHFRGWGVRYESPRLHGKRRGVAGEGAATPVVWCDRPIDPGHQGRGAAGAGVGVFVGADGGAVCGGVGRYKAADGIGGRGGAG